MCGFAGIVGLERALPRGRRAELRAMLETISHRGPDGSGEHFDDSVALGFRRLAIIDVDGGAQPLCNEDQQVWLVVNGEIYNYRSLRRELVSRGHAFRTRSDSEVVVHAYEEWGVDCFSRLEGMFAVALWDRPSRRLVLGRDRSGIKPLVYTRSRGELRFASEAKALLAGRRAHRALDLRGLFDPHDSEALHERTAFEGIEQVAAGCIAVFENGELHRKRYWGYEPGAGDDGLSATEHQRRFESAVAGAIESHLASDVPLGAYLSGGVDSSLVVAQMCRAHGRVATLTTVFDSERSSDATRARQLTHSLDLDARFVPAPADARVGSLLPHVAWLAEADFDAGWISRLTLSLAARRRGIKVVLSGQGIDEILTGYHPTFESFARLSAMERLSGATRELARTLTPSRLVTTVGDDDVTSRLRFEHAQLSRGLLRFEDRTAMAHGVELRVPFLDRRVVETAAAFPARLRPLLLSDKAVLRRVAARWLPPSIARRRKLAFNGNTLPLTRMAGESSELRQLLDRATLKAFGYFDPDAVARVAAEGRFHLLDRVLVVQLLHDLFVRSFDPARFRRTPPLIEQYAERASSSYSPPWARGGSPAAAATVPTLSPSVIRIRTSHAADGAQQLRPSPWATVEFAETARAPVQIPRDGLSVLEKIDGKSSYRSIGKQLKGAVSMSELLAFGTTLTDLGVVHTRKDDE